MSESCIFCKIIKREIPANIVLENEEIVAFKDIQPEAPEHVLVIPKQHVESLDHLDAEKDAQIWSGILKGIQTVAKTLKLDETGYRVVNNIGVHGGQTVHHIHFHVLGGRSMQWPPG